MSVAALTRPRLNPVTRGATLFAVIATMLVSAGVLAPRPALQSAAARDPFRQLLALSTDRGPVARGTTLGVMLELRKPNPGTLAAVPVAGTTVLTPAQYQAAHGAAPADVALVVATLTGLGLRAHLSGDASVWVEGPVEKIEQLFGAAVHDYTSPSSSKFYASATDPQPPASLAMVVTGVSRISSYRPPGTFRAVPSGGLTPADIALDYDIKALHDLGIKGAGETIAIWGTDGHKQADLDAFTTKFGLPPIQVTEMNNPNAPAASGGEEDMDIEVVHEIAPAAKIVVYTPLSGTLAELTRTIDKMVQDNPQAIQTHSWGLCEAEWGQALVQHWLDAMHKAADLGETVFVASGDRGGYECPPTDWGTPPNKDWLGLGIPDAIPYVVSVGGTRISVSDDHSYYNETVWTEPARNLASTGGVSSHYLAGTWQKGPGVKNQFYNGHRMEPDVSAIADGDSGLAIYVNGWVQGSGTSQASPIWAGITALANEYLIKHGLKRVGFLTPALYDLAAGNPKYPPFHDIIVGSSMNFPSTPGYDLATGLGTPDTYNLVRDLEAYQRNGGRP